MATLTPYAFFQEFDNNGSPLVGGKLYTYEAGTSTPKATYTDSTEAVQNANPVILNSAGRADVWLGDGGYKFVLKDASDVTIKTVDNIGGTNSTAFGGDVQILATNTAINGTFANAALVCTSAITLSLLSVTEAGEGFYISVRNSSAGDVIIDPDTTEQIDGASTLTIRSGFSALIICTGANWRTIFSHPNNAIGFNDMNSTAITGQAIATLATNDKILFSDFSASDALKKCDVSDIIALVPAGPSAASQAEQETGSATNVYVTPGRQQFHQSAAKFWGKADAAGALNASYNVTSVTDDGIGLLTVTIATDFSSANWGCWVTVERGSGVVTTSSNLIWATIKNSSQLAGAVSFECTNSSGYADPTRWHFGGFGDQ